MNSALKNLLGGVPGAATVYGAVRPGRPRTRYNLEQLAARLPAVVQENVSACGQGPARRACFTVCNAPLLD